MKHLLAALAVAALALPAFAQTPAPVAMPSVPTTKVLAIGRIAKGVTRDKVMAVMQREVRDTVRLYLAGKHHPGQ